MDYFIIQCQRIYVSSAGAKSQKIYPWHTLQKSAP